MAATTDQLNFLDELRESGATNMFAATPYIIEEFDVSRSEAVKILSEWMETFKERHNKE